MVAEAAATARGGAERPSPFSSSPARHHSVAKGARLADTLRTRFANSRHQADEALASVTAARQPHATTTSWLTALTLYHIIRADRLRDHAEGRLALVSSWIRHPARHYTGLVSQSGPIGRGIHDHRSRPSKSPVLRSPDHARRRRTIDFKDLCLTVASAHGPCRSGGNQLVGALRARHDRRGLAGCSRTCAAASYEFDIGASPATRLSLPRDGRVTSASATSTARSCCRQARRASLRRGKHQVTAGYGAHVRSSRRGPGTYGFFPQIETSAFSCGRPGSRSSIPEQGHGSSVSGFNVSRYRGRGGVLAVQPGVIARRRRDRRCEASIGRAQGGRGSWSRHQRPSSPTRLARHARARLTSIHRSRAAA
jgi:hypothetical protein